MMNWRLSLVLVALVLGASCSASSTPTLQRTVFTYFVDPPNRDLHAGERVSLTVRATTADGETTSDKPPPVRLCVALAGPYPSVQDLKSRPSSAGVRSCPVTGDLVVVAGDAVEADAWVEQAIKLDFLLPASLAPGFYEFVTVSMVGPTSAPSWVSTTGVIVRVVAAP